MFISGTSTMHSGRTLYSKSSDQVFKSSCWHRERERENDVKNVIPNYHLWRQHSGRTLDFDSEGQGFKSRCWQQERENYEEEYSPVVLAQWQNTLLQVIRSRVQIPLLASRERNDEKKMLFQLSLVALAQQQNTLLRVISSRVQIPLLAFRERK